LNQKLKFIGENFDRQKNKRVRIYKGQACSSCQNQKGCTKQKGGVRYLKMFPHEVERNAMGVKMKTQKAIEIYKLRQQIVEPVIGDIKENKGVRAFITRGIKTVKAEFNIICAAINLKRIWIYLKKKKSDIRRLRIYQSLRRQQHLEFKFSFCFGFAEY
jgi:transposase